MDMKLLPGLLLPWYEKNARDLPWRRDKEPYHVWLSEIMLQQTRVEAARGYYLRFLSALPSIEALSRAEEETVLKLWEGLGYYSRARNLHRAAKAIMEEHGGRFPENYRDIRALPGVGDYTAGAVASICFNLPCPAVDGNVLRIMARLLKEEESVDSPRVKKRFHSLLKEVYPLSRCGDFTQALMELGATHCGPNWKPRCEKCPCQPFCLAHRRGTAETLPVKSAKKARREEDRTVLILSCAGQYALEKRPGKGLLAGLWQFPNVSGKLEPQQAMELAAQWVLHPQSLLRQAEKKHIFTHIQWNMRGFYIEVECPSPLFQWFTPEQINENAALPTAFRQFWEE